MVEGKQTVDIDFSPADFAQFKAEFLTSDRPIENILGIVLRLQQLKFANMVYRSIGDQAPEKTFSDFVASFTSIKAELADAWHSVGPFPQEQSAAIDAAFKNAGILGVMQYLESIKPASCPTLENTRDFGEGKELIKEEGTYRICKEEWPGEALGRPEEKVNVLTVEIYPPITGKATGPPETLMILKKVLSEVAELAKVHDVVGVGAVSWFFDLPEAKKLFKFHVVPYSDNEWDMYRNRAMWLQIFNVAGTLSERMRRMIEHSTLPHALRIGFMFKDELIRRHGKK